MSYEISEIEGGICAPSGFKASGVSAGLKQNGLKDCALLVSEEAANFAGNYTECKFRAAPVDICIQTEKLRKPVRAVFINSGNANACTGSDGMLNAQKSRKMLSEKLHIAENDILISSTGRIGEQLPMDKISTGIEMTSKSLSQKTNEDFAEAILTTDTRKKECAVEINTPEGSFRIGGTAKGSGMIAPNMKGLHATMLSYITTDADLSYKKLKKTLEKAVERTFNRITVDGDISTNDTVLVLSNGKSGIKIDKGEMLQFFEMGLTAVCQQLAQMIVRDGEGVTKFITLTVNGALNEKEALLCGRKIAESLLCKTAWFGADPNWGRILAAAGNSKAHIEPDKFDMDYGKYPVVRNGIDAGTDEAVLAEIMKKDEFSIKVNLNLGNGQAVLWTNDISYDYVKINAEYKT